MIIGKFSKIGAEYEGMIETLALPRLALRFVAVTNRSNDKAPSHRAMFGNAEVGAGWTDRTNDNRPYLSVKLDDPSFVAPISASLFENEDGECTLVWNRPRRQNNDR